ncbi:MAG: AMP-binding protein [Gammaproteobacteria bacterium]|jgi:long-chain acyl-CoA synthetase|nr:AMP-binding protein [Gammaproteobacteria bacterium]MBU0773553.1 AMP-binding protein [Gammaproteobacteria bacterium]MBU0857683.1 AMP-binding protein [Gammaproteobacteria bacterium]MBU1848099.1 AMP-binding protein [Gammaproteobacteria bacterium]
MNLAEMLVRAGRTEGHRPALIHGTTVRATYAALAGQASHLAGGLRTRMRLTPGERIAIVMKNTPDYVTVLFAAWWAGLVVVPVNAKLHPAEIDFILEDSGASACVVTADFAGALSGAASVRDGRVRVIELGGADWKALLAAEPMAQPEPAHADTLSWLFYTSGTTGQPKGAMLSAGNLSAMTACYFMDVDSVAPTDCVLHPAPMSHGSGMYILPHVLAAAAQVVPESGGFDPQEIAALCRAHTGVSFFAAPTMVHRLVNCRDIDHGNLPGLKTIVYGGGPMYVADSLRALDTLGERLVQIYGQGETPMTITALNKRRHRADGMPGQAARLASVGVAQSLVEVRVGDEAGRALPCGDTGEVMVRGPTVMLGYWGRPAATAETIRDGWLLTGDLGAFDAAGYLTLKDRSKDVIISGGTNVYPREVEECLLTHPGVREVSVIGRPDPDWGEDIVAFVVAAGTPAPGVAELDAHCLARIARFKRPKDYRFIEALPKNNYGKVTKTTLRSWLSEEDDKGESA